MQNRKKKLTNSNKVRICIKGKEETKKNLKEDHKTRWGAIILRKTGWVIHIWSNFKTFKNLETLVVAVNLFCIYGEMTRKRFNFKAYYDLALLRNFFFY